jgi:ABC-2 type transport system ATP-binding protein
MADVEPEPRGALGDIEGVFVVSAEAVCCDRRQFRCGLFLGASHAVDPRDGGPVRGGGRRDVLHGVRGLRVIVGVRFRCRIGSGDAAGGQEDEGKEGGDEDFRHGGEECPVPYEGWVCADSARLGARCFRSGHANMLMNRLLALRRTSMTLAIESVGLAKDFGKTRALDGVDLKVPKGAVYGLLGPNGAGKTTAIRLFATLLRPDEGHASVLGHDVVREAREVREKVCLTGQFASIDDELTGRENLVLVGRLLGLPRRDAKERSDELLSAFDLSGAARRQVRTYSGGMRRRLDIAASLVVTPELLFLDEPTTGLDPRSRSQVWDVVRAITGEGTTVLLTTQYLEEADRLARRLAVIDQGRLIAEGSSDDLKASVGRNTLHVRLQDPGVVAEAERMLRELLDAEVRIGGTPGSLVASVSDAERLVEAYGALSKRGLRLAEFSIGRPSLDEVFFALTGRPVADETDVQTKGAVTPGVAH